MPFLRSYLWSFTALALAVMAAVSARAESPQEPVSQPASAPAAWPSGQAIRLAIRELNHPSPTRRRGAVQRLTLWGPLAIGELERVAGGPELESALLARDLLADLGEVVFVGSRVTLEADRSRVRWDEPITLTLTVENPTDGRILLPWPAHPSVPPAEDDAHQVGAMLDVADFITVQSPTGEAIAMRVEPIEHETAVHQAVAIRAGSHPPAHFIAPGSSEQLALRQFNRGWARFPMLAKGKYIVQFTCQPEWKDPSWTAKGVGLVRSNAVTIEVSDAAPSEIMQATLPLRLLTRREGDQLICELQNTWDRDTWVNLNLGGPQETHARLQWTVLPGKGEPPDPFQLDSDVTDRNFAPDKIVRLSPGDKTLLTKTTPAAILERARKGADISDPIKVSLRYAHIPTAQQLRQSLRAKGRHDSIPAELFNGTVVAEPINLPAK